MQTEYACVPYTPRGIDQVLKLIEKKLQLTEAAGAFEARKKRRLTDDRAESEVRSAALMFSAKAKITDLAGGRSLPDGYIF